MPFDIEKCKPDVLDRFWSKVDKSGECWTWTAGMSIDGYGQFSPYPACTMQAHRFISLYLNGPVEPGEHVLHTCDNPACVRPAHLWHGTNQENINDMVRKHRSTWGENNTHARLTADQVREIRRRAQEGEARDTLAADYGITRDHIRMIEQCKRWTHI